VDEDIYTAVNGIPAANAAKRLALPAVFRRQGRNQSHDGTNTWISLSVAGGGTANVTLEASGGSGPGPGCTDLSTTTETTFKVTRQIKGSFIFYQNADSDNGLGPDVACFAGGVIVTSDVPLFGVVGYINPPTFKDTDAIYNAIPLP
jgi:hypothetical protein